MKKMEWMVAAGSVAALAGAVHSAGCVTTASECTLLGSCGGGASTSTASESSAGGSSTATSTATASVTATSTTASSTAASTTASASSSSSGTGGMVAVAVCDDHHYGDGGNQVARSVHVAANDDVLFAGDITGALTIGATKVTPKADDLFVASVNKAWGTNWLETFPVSYGAIAYDPSGAVVLAGSFAGPVSFGCPAALDFPDNLYVVKLDASGKCVWARGFVAAGAHVSLAVDAAGQIALAGDADAGTAVDFHKGGVLVPQGMNGGGRDMFATTLDKDGIVGTPAAYGGPADDVINAVAFDGAGGIVVAGAFKSSTLAMTSGGNPLTHSGGALDEPFVAGINSGAGTWSLGFPGAGAAQGVAVVGGVPIVAGHFTGTLDTGGAMLTATGDDLFLLGIKPSGMKHVVAWSKAFVGMGAKTVSGFATNGTDALALTGAIDGDVDFGLGTLTATKGIYVAKVASTNGKALWNHTFGTTDAFLSADGVAVDSAGVHVAGSYGIPLDLGDNMPMVNGGGADLFVATFSTACP